VTNQLINAPALPCNWKHGNCIFSRNCFLLICQ